MFLGCFLGHFFALVHFSNKPQKFMSDVKIIYLLSVGKKYTELAQQTVEFCKKIPKKCKMF